MEGGVNNAYDYPADPINGVDLTGMWTWEQTWLVCAIVLAAVATVALAVTIVGSPGAIATGAGTAALAGTLAASLAAEAVVPLAAAAVGSAMIAAAPSVINAGIAYAKTPRFPAKNGSNGSGARKPHSDRSNGQTRRPAHEKADGYGGGRQIPPNPNERAK